MNQGNISSGVIILLVVLIMLIGGGMWIYGMVNDYRKLRRQPALEEAQRQLERAYQDFLRSIPFQIHDATEQEAKALDSTYPQIAAMLRAFASVIKNSDFSAAEEQWRQNLETLRRRIPVNRWTWTRIGGAVFGVLFGAIVGLFVGNPASITNLQSVVMLIWQWTTHLRA